MKRLTLIRLAILIAMRDLLIPGGGLFLAVYLPLTDSLSPWHLPLIAGMLGTPLVARGGELPPQTDATPPPDPGSVQPPSLRQDLIQAGTEQLLRQIDPPQEDGQP